MATSLEQHLQLNEDHNIQNNESKKEEIDDEVINPINTEHTESQHYDNPNDTSKQIENNTKNDPFDNDYENDPFNDNSDDEKMINTNNNLQVISETKKSPKSLLQKQLTLYSTLEEIDEPLPLPYKKSCNSKISYYFETFLVTHPRMYALFLLYQATWPRGLVLLDMYTDVQVALSLYNKGQSFWFLLSSIFVLLPFILVWTVSLRFIQKFINYLYSKEKYNTKCMSTMINFGLTLYIFPPIGALFVALYEIYLVFYDILNGIKCFIFGTGLVETQTNDIRAMKQYRRAVEIFSESVPQTVLQLYMFWRNVPVNETDLYLSLAISGFNLLINAYRFRKEAKINGMSIAEYALSVLQLAEIPIVRLVPRLPAVKKGKLEFINLAGFAFDKESITPIIDALSEVKCVLNTMKISVGSLINLDLESCKLIGRILNDARIRVFISRTFSLLHIKNLFEQLDDDHNGYLDENEFSNALKSLNSGLLYMDVQQQKRIFQKLAIRRIKKRDRVYFYDFFKNIAGVTNKTLEFDITQMDFPLHYIFQHLITEISDTQNNDTHVYIAIESMKKLYSFCCGLDCFDQIDSSINNHIFFTIIDALNTIEYMGKDSKINNNNAYQFVSNCFVEILNSDTINNNIASLLEMRNIMFERDNIYEDNKLMKYHNWVLNMQNTKQYDGLNIFEYCFAFGVMNNKCYYFVHLLDVYLKTKTKYSGQQNDKDIEQLFSDKNGPLFNLYKESKFRWKENKKLSIEYAAKDALFDVIEFFCKYLITDYTVDEIHKVCVALLSNEEQQNPDTLALILKYSQENDMKLFDITNSNESLDEIILKTQKKIELNRDVNMITQSQFNEINNELLKYLEILNEFGFNWITHFTLQHAVKSKNYDIMNKIITMCRSKSYDDIINVLNETNNLGETAIMAAYYRQDLAGIELLLKCEEQNCNELFSRFRDNLKNKIQLHLWIKFLYDIMFGIENINICNRLIYELKQEIYNILSEMIDKNELENETMSISKGQTIIEENKNKSMMKKIFRFGGVFGQNTKRKNDNNNNNNNGKKVNTNVRISFHSMTISICNKLKNSLSTTKPKVEIDSYEIKIEKHIEEKQEIKQETQTYIPMIDLLTDDDKDGTLSTQLNSCQQMVKSLRTQIKNIIEKSNGEILSDICSDVNIQSYIPHIRKEFHGHFGKIYALDWSANSANIVSASQDGKIVVWDVLSMHKLASIPLRSAWVMTCSFSASGEYIASGGLDNIISVFRVGEDKDTYRELQQHEGYISCISFINDEKILSSSGDANIILWDIETSKPILTFTGHTGDVETIDINTQNKNIIVSGSIDATLKIWDIRTNNKCITTFNGHQTDINSVKWFIDGNAIISGSDDATIRFFDLKTYQQMNIYKSDDIYSSVTDVDISKTGQYIFAGYDEEPYCLMWSTLTAQKMSQLKHSTHLSCLSVSPNGHGIATGCWDKILRLWA